MTISRIKGKTDAMTNDVAPVRPVAEPKVRRTEDKSVRRAQLIDATITCIAKFGISGTTLAKVTEEAGLSLGLANFHFASKEVLLHETLRFVAGEHRDRWQKAVQSTTLGDKDRFLAIIESFFHPQVCSRKKLSVWFAFFGEAGNRNAYRSVVEDIDEERHQESMRLIRRIAAEDDTAIDPVMISLTLEALMDGLWLNMLLYPDEFTRDVAKQQVRQLLALMFPRQFPIAIPKTDGKA